MIAPSSFSSPVKEILLQEQCSKSVLENYCHIFYYRIKALTVLDLLIQDNLTFSTCNEKISWRFSQKEEGGFDDSRIFRSAERHSWRDVDAACFNRCITVPR